MGICEPKMLLLGRMVLWENRWFRRLQLLSHFDERLYRLFFTLVPKPNQDSTCLEIYLAHHVDLAALFFVVGLVDANRVCPEPSRLFRETESFQGAAEAMVDAQVCTIVADDPLHGLVRSPVI